MDTVNERAKKKLKKNKAANAVGPNYFSYFYRYFSNKNVRMS